MDCELKLEQIKVGTRLFAEIDRINLGWVKGKFKIIEIIKEEDKELEILMKNNETKWLVYFEILKNGKLRLKSFDTRNIKLIHETPISRIEVKI